MQNIYETLSAKKGEECGDLGGNRFLNSHWQSGLDRIIAGSILWPVASMAAVTVGPFLQREGGSVFYLSQRVGKGGRIFDMWKLRTMVEGADRFQHQDRIQQIQDDHRVTKLGRFLRKISLDETLQCVNVLRGEMSIVSPRPYVPQDMENLRTIAINNGMAALYDEWEIGYKANLPGVTGYTAVNYGRGGLVNTPEGCRKKMKGDIYWFENASPRLYLEVVARTFPSLVVGHGVY